VETGAATGRFGTNWSQSIENEHPGLCIRPSENTSSEAVRKVSDALAAWPHREPKGSLLAHFVLRIAAKFMLGALLKALFGQFQKGNSAKFALLDPRA
jgi:hypothetical protein